MRIRCIFSIASALKIWRIHFDIPTLNHREFTTDEWDDMFVANRAISSAQGGSRELGT
jgi:hypothetical protein